MDDNVVSAKETAFWRGRRMFRNGEPRPQNKWTDAEWDQMNDEQCIWLGWMFEKGRNWLSFKPESRPDDFPPTAA